MIAAPKRIRLSVVSPSAVHWLGTALDGQIDSVKKNLIRLSVNPSCRMSKWREEMGRREKAGNQIQIHGLSYTCGTECDLAQTQKCDLAQTQILAGTVLRPYTTYDDHRHRPSTDAMLMPPITNDDHIASSSRRSDHRFLCSAFTTIAILACACICPVDIEKRSYLLRLAFMPSSASASPFTI